MPSRSSVRLAGRWDCSTTLMISSFSDAGYLIRRPPHPDKCFFQQTVFERQVGNAFLERAGFAAQILHLASGCGTSSITGKSALAGFHELPGPGVIQALGPKSLAPSFRHSSAMLSSPRRLSSTMRILSSAEKCRRVARRMSFTTRSAGAFAGDFFKEGWVFILWDGRLLQSGQEECRNNWAEELIICTCWRSI
jgi:hypothetical protein